jgi:hypothetical protein
VLSRSISEAQAVYNVTGGTSGRHFNGRNTPANFEPATSNYMAVKGYCSRYLIAICLGLGGGCADNGPELAPVEGVVSLNGKPVPDALVEFQPQIGAGSPSYGSTDSQGKYVMLFSQQRAGALVGEHLVRISTANENEYVKEELPLEYNLDSQLVRTVKAGETNVFDFDIEVKK